LGFRRRRRLGGVTILEGLERLRNPRVPANPLWSYVVLGVAFVFHDATLAEVAAAIDRIQGEVQRRNPAAREIFVEVDALTARAGGEPLGGGASRR
jgi:hypothetical protein